jgi:HK97 family phage portal protein
MNDQPEKRGLWNALTGWARPSFKNQTVVSSNVDGMNELFRPVSSPSGYAVTDKTALQVSTVYACITVLAGTIAQLPVAQYRLQPDGMRKPIKRNNLWYLLNETPAPAWTAASWKEWIVRCVILRGDQHTEIIRSKTGASLGEVVGFKIHHPDNVVVRRVGDRLAYDVMDITTAKGYTVDQDDMLHFTGMGFDGLRSQSAIQNGARTAIGNSLASTDYSGKSIGGGAMPQISIQYPNKMGADQTELLRKSFVATYGQGGGESNARRLPLVLTEGAEVKELSISPVDMELLSSREYEDAQICNAIGVPPILIGNGKNTSNWGTGVEQITLGWVKFRVKPHLRRWQEEMNRKLYRNAGPFLEFDLDELLRGDSKAQADADRASLGGAQGDGWRTPNEVRASRNLPPLKGGDELFKVAKSADPAAAPAPNPAPTEGNP